MAISLKHAFTSAIADGGDTSLVQPSNWNAEHNLTMATSRILGRTTAGAGSAEEISVGTGLSLSSGSLAVSTIPVANGGTGITSYTTGDILYASSASALSALADVATGNALISGGVGVAPSWGKVGLTTHVSGTLPVANGGTGVVSATAYALLAGGTTSTGAFQSLGTGTSGQSLLSGGASALPTWGSPAALSTASGSAPSYSARAWVNFQGTGTVAINASGNVSSITDNGTGDYTMNFTTAMSDTNYAVAGAVFITSGSQARSLGGAANYTFATGSLRFQTMSTSALTDYTVVTAAIFR